MVKFLKDFYKKCALVVFALILLFIFSNIALGSIYFVKDYLSTHALTKQKGSLFTKDGKPVQNGKRTEFQLESIDFNSCKEFGEKYISDVLDDFYELDSKGLSGDQWVRYYFPEFHGKKTNIFLDEKGFPVRKTLNPKAASDKKVITIFVLGSSTNTCPYVSDEHTWPTFLSQVLNEKAKAQGKPVQVRVENYGRAGYDPAQEAGFVFDLLKSGHRPNLVLFLDGYNWGPSKWDLNRINVKTGSDFLSSFLYKKLKVKYLLSSFELLPIGRLASPFVKRFNIAQANAKESINKIDNDLDEDIKQEVQNAIVNFEQNKKLINAVCSAYGVSTLFFLQPHPMYAYDLNLFFPELKESLLGENNKLAVEMFYEAMRKKKEYIDVSSIYNDWGTNKKAYIDDYHYSPAFNKYLAKRITDHINLDSLNLEPAPIVKSEMPNFVRFKIN